MIFIGGNKMEEYQFGKHLAYEEVLKNKAYYAHIFAEENPTLEKLLMTCFDKGIETYMCCTAHEEGDAAFLMLHIPYSQKELIHKIVSSVYYQRDVIIRLGKEHNHKGILVDMKSYSGGYFFNNLLKELSTERPIIKINPDVAKTLEILNQFNHDSYDLYFETSNYAGQRSYEVYANYITIEDGRPVRHRYVLDKKIKYQDLVIANEFFTKDELEEKELEYTGEVGKQKIMHYNDGKTLLN